MPDALKEQVFNRLEELAAVANLSMEDRIAYDKALDRYRVSRIVEEDARRAGWQQGLEEGLKEGREKGMAEGMEKGMEKGKNEEKRAIAHNLKALGLTSEQIQAATGLSAKEINQL